MKTRIINFVEKLRVNIWLVPVAMMILGVLVAVAVARLDRVAGAQIHEYAAYFGPGTVAGARALLSTLTAALVTVVGVVFSVVVVVLTLASNQFGPRLVRNFMRDRITQVSIGLFMASFTFNVVVLGALDRQIEGVHFPQLSTSSAVVLSLIAASGFVFLIHHVAASIRAEAVIAQVARDFARTLSSLAEEEKNLDSSDRSNSENHALDFAVESSISGYIQGLDYEQLVALCQTHGAFVATLAKPGDYLLRGSKLADVSGSSSDDLRDEIASVFLIGKSASPEQDCQYTIRQMVDVAVRALSPGTNDPHTAVACIDQLTACILDASDVFPLGEVLTDADGRARVKRATNTLGDIVDCAFDQIRQYGRDSVAVNLRLLENLTELARLIDDASIRACLETHVDAISDGLVHTTFGNADMETLKRAVAAFRQC